MPAHPRASAAARLLVYLPFRLVTWKRRGVSISTRSNVRPRRAVTVSGRERRRRKKERPVAGPIAQWYPLVRVAVVVPYPVAFSVRSASLDDLSEADSKGWRVLRPWQRAGALREVSNFLPRRCHLSVDSARGAFPRAIFQPRADREIIT